MYTCRKSHTESDIAKLEQAMMLIEAAKSLAQSSGETLLASRLGLIAGELQGIISYSPISK